MFEDHGGGKKKLYIYKIFIYTYLTLQSTNLSSRKYRVISSVKL